MKVGFVGGGKMAEAMIAALIRTGTLEAHAIFASDVSQERRSLLKSSHGINVYSKNRVIPGFADVVILAVKPQHLGAVLDELVFDLKESHLVISIAAGKTIKYLESVIEKSRVIRVMPNIACQVFEGMSAYCGGTCAAEPDLRTAAKLLGCFGKVMELPEEQFDAVTALSGSGPAFFTYLLDGMVSAAVDEGLSREDALLLAEQTMLGTSKVLIEQGADPGDLIKAVASPGGTTEAGLAVLERSSIAGILDRMIHAATRRSKELSK